MEAASQHENIFVVAPPFPPRFGSAPACGSMVISHSSLTRHLPFGSLTLASGRAGLLSAAPAGAGAIQSESGSLLPERIFKRELIKRRRCRSGLGNQGSSEVSREDTELAHRDQSKLLKLNRK